MALAPVTLDDVTWSQLVDTARARIPAASKGRWTLHAPVDPGVTILDLTAWLIEQRIYRLDRVSDPLGHAIGALFGERCRSARPAVTVLALANADGADDATVAAGTPFWLRDADPPLVFTLDDDLTVLPITRLRVEYAGRDRSDDLAYVRPLDLVGVDGPLVELRLVLELDPEHPTAPTAPVTLFVDVETPAGVALPWLPSDDPLPELPARAVTWSYHTSAGEVEVPPASVNDGTSGLRRSGIVRLSPGADWALDPRDPATAPPSYTLTLRFDGGDFPIPPRLKRVLANAVVARNVEPREARFAAPASPLPGHTVALVEGDEALPLEDTVEVSVHAPDGTAESWLRVDDFARSGPNDPVFVVDRDRGLVRFGDGVTGRIPPLPAGATIDVHYAVGGGERGNVAGWREWSDVDGEVLARNVVPAEGGRDTETVAALHDRIATELRRPERAVLAADFERVVLRTPGVGIRRAHAVVGHHPDFPCATVPGAVTVFVVPDAPRPEKGDDVDLAFVPAPQPDAGLLAAAHTRLATARLLGTEIFVSPPRYRGVTLAFDIVVSGSASEDLRDRVRGGLQRFLDPLIGGEHADGWPFGEPLRPSALIRTAQTAVGREGEVQSVAIGIDGIAPVSACRDVDVGPHDLVVLTGLAVGVRRPTPGAADRGGLQ